MKSYLKLLRINHWIKNILVFIPIVFARELNCENILKTLLAFFAFSFMTSFVYIINDIRDIEKDKLHPRKSKRPLPSGKIKKSRAILVSIIMLILSFAINIITNRSILNNSLYFLVLYMLTNITYSFGLKNIAIIDILLLAAGFILRVYYGAAIINVEVSNWLFLTILNASLSLGFGKRKKELINNKETRKVLTEYSEEFLDKFQYLTLGLTLAFYSLWVTEQEIQYLFLTIPLIMSIFMKYSLVIEKSQEGDPTTILYQDKLLIILCIIYAISIMFLLGVI